MAVSLFTRNAFEGWDLLVRARFKSVNCVVLWCCTSLFGCVVFEDVLNQFNERTPAGSWLGTHQKLMPVSP